MVVFALNSDLICNTNYMYMFNVHGMCVSHCFLLISFLRQLVLIYVIVKYEGFLIMCVEYLKLWVHTNAVYRFSY